MSKSIGKFTFLSFLTFLVVEYNQLDTKKNQLNYSSLLVYMPFDINLRYILSWEPLSHL